MKDNSKELVSYLKNLYFVKASNEMDVDTIKLIDLVRAVKNFFNFISVESIHFRAVILYIDYFDTALLPNGSFISLSSLDDLHEYLKDVTDEFTCIFDDTGKVYIIWGDASSHNHIFNNIVRYRIDKTSNRLSEQILFNQSVVTIHPYPEHKALLPRFDFDCIINHLEEYKLENAAYSSCMLLENCWNDQHRILFVQKPEHFMRDSIFQFLKNTIGKIAHIKREQNTNETKPVDLNIQFHGTNRTVLVEVKWLGASINEDQSGIGTKYSESRANEGSKQLCDYIDKEKTSTPRKNILGILVVFDGRRKGANAGCHPPPHADAHYYKDKEITYNPAYYKLRQDFAVPMRFFMHPKISG